MKMCLLLGVLGLWACAAGVDDKWAEVRAADTVESYRSFKRTFPKSSYAAEADQRIKELHHAEEWEVVRGKDTPEAYANYARMYPDSAHAAEANAKLAEYARAEEEARAKAAAATAAPVIDMSSDDDLARLEKENPGLDDETRKRLREAQQRIRDEYGPKIEALEAERRTAKQATADSDSRIRELRTGAKDDLVRAKQMDDFVKQAEAQKQDKVPGSNLTVADVRAEGERFRNDAQRKTTEADQIEAETAGARDKVKDLDDRIKAMKREERDRIREQLDIITGFTP